MKTELYHLRIFTDKPHTHMGSKFERIVWIC